MADDGGLASEYAASEEHVKKPRKRWSMVETEHVLSEPMP